MESFNGLMRTCSNNFLKISVFLLCTSSAYASNMWDPSQSTCSTINCSTVPLNGTVLNLTGVVGGNNVLPWVGSIWADEGECLRVDLTAMTSGNLEMVVIAPNGTLYRNDNRSPSNSRPLIKIDSTPTVGYYTLQVSTSDGVPATIDFTLLLGRYNTGNANCTTPTPSI